MKLKDQIRDTLLRAMAPSDFYPPLPGTVAVIGDSIMFSVVPWLRNQGVAIRNELSQPGDTAQDAWRRMPYDKLDAEFVIMSCGTNDISRGWLPFDYLRRMGERFTKQGRRVLYTGISQRLDMDVASFNGDIQRIALDLGGGFAHWGVYPLAYLENDILHPDTDSQQWLADRLAVTLETMKGK